MAEGKYQHWDKLRHYSPPEGLSLEEWWLTLKLQRRSMYKPLVLQDNEGKHFQYLVIDPLPEDLHVIDQGAGGFIRMPEQITNRNTRDQYYINSLIREAITSSQLEGAATTRKIAKEMIQTGRPARDRSELMILNNFKTMQRIGRIKNETLSKDLVFEIQRLVTDGTLDDSSGSGRFRRDDERVVVSDEYNEILHTPPPASQLEDRMEAMCEFANDKRSDRFIHPVIRSIILHFWLAYDHPFVDGNLVDLTTSELSMAQVRWGNIE
ncbi:MAG: Fic family protein, partial [Planctomycetes bacterium]|nr:Fic family protein [Planctomycetota bacterium]